MKDGDAQAVMIFVITICNFGVPTSGKYLAVPPPPPPPTLCNIETPGKSWVQASTVVWELGRGWACVI